MIKKLVKGLLIALALLFVLPVIYTLTGSLMDTGQLLQKGLNPIPRLFTTQQYFSLVVYKAAYLKYFLNSLFIALTIIVFQLSIALLAAYGFAKFSFKFKNILFGSYVFVLLLPFQVTFVPNLLVMQQLQKTFNIQLLDSHLALILPGVFSVFGVYLMSEFIRRFPDALIEAARIDGAGEIRIFFSIVLPNLKAPLFALIFLLFVDYWNMIEQVIIYIDSASKLPLSVFLETLYYEDFSVFYAAATLYILPAIYIFIKFQDFLREGIGGGYRQ